MLIVFLVELKDEAAAAALYGLAKEKQNQPDGKVLVGVKEGRLFCLAVAGAFVVGEAPFETRASMQRFSAGIAPLLHGYLQS
jgi:hypothetical protein